MRTDNADQMRTDETDQSLVNWQETLLSDEREVARVAVPVFVRDVDAYGERFHPEISGVSIQRNLRFPIKLPFCERLSFLLQRSVYYAVPLFDLDLNFLVAVFPFQLRVLMFQYSQRTLCLTSIYKTSQR